METRVWPVAGLKTKACPTSPAVKLTFSSAPPEPETLSKAFPSARQLATKPAGARDTRIRWRSLIALR